MGKMLTRLDKYPKLGYDVFLGGTARMETEFRMEKCLFKFPGVQTVSPFRTQLLKWVGNKQRFAHEIASYFPTDFGVYFEPFLGSGAVLSTLAPRKAVASDCFSPLIEIFSTLKHHPRKLKTWYQTRWDQVMGGDKKEGYEHIRSQYNHHPNGADLLFLCRSCYGGVVRFRKADGHMSTPCGIHTPITPESFSKRVDVWHGRIEGTDFSQMDFEEAMSLTKPGDLVYCDPPYRHSQAILYGAQEFRLESLLETIEQCKSRGVYVALSIDGTKQSGTQICPLPIPHGLFEREIMVNCGRSMLKRFQMNGQTLAGQTVHDRLLLTY